MIASVKCDKFDNLLSYLSGHIMEIYDNVIMPYLGWMFNRHVYIRSDSSNKDRNDFAKLSYEWNRCTDISKQLYSTSPIDDLDYIFDEIPKYIPPSDSSLDDQVYYYLITLMVHLMLNGYEDVLDIPDFNYEYDYHEMISLTDDKNNYFEYIDWVKNKEPFDDYEFANKLQLHNIIVSLKAFQTNYNIDVNDLIMYTESMLN